MRPLIPYWENDFSIPLPFKIPLVGADAIHLFGILVAVGFMVGAHISMNKARRDGQDPELINKLVGWIVVGVFVGGHWGHLLFYYPSEIMKDPMVLFRFTSGLSSMGGFLFSTILCTIFYRREIKKVERANVKRAKKGEPLITPISFWGQVDCFCYGFTIAWMFGRLGCFSAHDHPGTPTNFWLGVPGMNPAVGCTKEVACHDLGLYEAIWSLLMYFVFRPLDKKPRFPGFFAGVWLISYGMTRVVLDVFRNPGIDTRYFGLTPAQYGSMIMFGIGVWILWSQRNQTPLRELPPVNPEAAAPAA